jgi:hypothetical protein
MIPRLVEMVADDRRAALMADAAAHRRVGARTSPWRDAAMARLRPSWASLGRRLRQVDAVAAIAIAGVEQRSGAERRVASTAVVVDRRSGHDRRLVGSALRGAPGTA